MELIPAEALGMTATSSGVAPKGEISGGPAFWIKKNLIPHQDEKIGSSGGTEINRRAGSRNQKI